MLDSSRAMKLIDFGLAAFYAPGKKLRVHCGSPSYAAPEIVARKMYEGPPVDVWSLGVVLFAMLAGFLPFHSPTGNKQVGPVCACCVGQGATSIYNILNKALNMDSAIFPECLTVFHVLPGCKAFLQ